MPTILMIDDDRDAHQIFGTALKEEKYSLIESFNGKEGIAAAKKTPPDLIVLDVMMPGKMNGFDVLEMLSNDQKLKDIPVILFTNIETEAQVAKSIGAKEYVVKVNTTPEQFVDIVKKYL